MNSADTVSRSATNKPKDDITAMLLPSILCILLAIFVLCGMTWAWFSSTQATETLPIRAAEYRVEILIQVGETAVNDTESGYPLVADTAYTVRITAGGSASTGFCTVKAGGGDYATAQMAPGESLTFTLTPASDCTLTVTPQWGTYTGTPAIKNGTDLQP